MVAATDQPMDKSKINADAAKAEAQSSASAIQTTETVEFIPVEITTTAK